MAEFRVPMFIRGQLIEDNWVQFGGRGDDISFQAPDPHHYIEQIPLKQAEGLSDLYTLTTGEVLDYLAELGSCLTMDNPHVQEALAVSIRTSGQTEPLLRAQYAAFPIFFDRATLSNVVVQRIGSTRYLDEWVEAPGSDGRTIAVRAFGARALHIVAGNGPAISAMSIIRNAISRSDAIIKSPSNDPFTALAIGRTMKEMAPDHPLTKHLTVAYWKGGDTEIEAQLYRPDNIEKIVAWGGLASVKHVTRYIQPGLELISLDPKRSASIIGAEVFDSEDNMLEVAQRLASDIGIANQEGCANARLAYVMSGTDDEGLERINKLGEMTYQSLMTLPEHVSTKPKSWDPELRSHLNALRLDDEWFKVIGGKDDEGAIIVSQMVEAVNFSQLLYGRVANLIPVDGLDEVLDAVNSYTQTVGIYPESLKKELRDRLPLLGAQRLVSLGYALSGNPLMTPQDAIEPLRRMCKWIVEESCDPREVRPPWSNQVIVE